MALLLALLPLGLREVEISARFAEWRCAEIAISRRSTQTATPAAPHPEGGLRIARFAGEAFGELGSTSQGMRATKAKRLLINGETATIQSRVISGDVVELLPRRFEATCEERHVKLAMGLVKSGNLAVPHEEEAMAVVHKPAGIHSKPYGPALTLEHALPGLLSPPDSADRLIRPSCVHRLDARVSGLIVVAKTRYAAAFLARAFRERRVCKRYRALLLGRLDHAELLRGGTCLEVSTDKGEACGADGSPSLRITSLIDGKRAESTLRVVDYCPHVQAGWLTTVDLIPHTGRRHQLRRHCAELGHPICGDDLYATAVDGFIGKRSAGLFLQSVEVSVPHPSDDGNWVHVQIPDAPKFQRQRERAKLGWLYNQRRLS